MDEKSTPEQEIELLTWALLDGDISDAELDRLDELLADAGARKRYQEVVQLDSQLHAYFAALRQVAPPSKGPDHRAA